MTGLTLLLLFLRLLISTSAIKLINFPARQLYDYRSYDDVTILIYKVPEQIQSVTWNLTARETKQSVSIKDCEPRPLTAYLKHGSYPVVNPDGSKFPDNYYTRNESLYEMKFSSNKIPIFLNIPNPMPGDWFNVVFIDYTDPVDDGITQDGLSLVCNVVLEASINGEYVQDSIIIAQGKTVKESLNQSKPIIKLQFFVPKDINNVKVNVLGESTKTISNQPEFALQLESSVRFSNEKTMSKKCPTFGECTFTFVPSDLTWYFLQMSIDPNTTTDALFSLDVEYSTRDIEHCTDTALLPTTNSDFPTCWTSIDLTRESKTSFFAYGFERAPFENGTALSYLEVSMNKPSVLSFNVNPIQDIGGVLSVEIKIIMDSLKNHTSEFQVMVLACIGNELMLAPQFPDECISSTGVTTPNHLKVNSHSEALKTNIGILHIPFPEYGRWILSLTAFCYTNYTNIINETACQDLEKINITFILESDSCDPDDCGAFGRCFTHQNGGLLFSSCVCYQGYRGWGCTDDSKVSSNKDLLIATLLLTLSNLFFIPAIVMSIRNQYYTEALVYTFAMFFSTFYHACDAGEGVYSLCIFRSSVLQFSDFYLAVLAVWVTIIAMANLAPWLCSLAQMAGAVLIALGSEINRTSLWMFLAPTLIGLATLAVTWGIRMKRTRSCYPNKKYWIYFLPPGLFIILVGLICYSFLQTAKNYKYVHSFWHAVMALSILIILPRPKPERFVMPVVVVEEIIRGDPDLGDVDITTKQKERFKWSKLWSWIKC